MSGIVNNPGTKSGKVGGFDDVENTKLSTYTGSTSITTLGTVTTGTMDTGVIFDDPTITQGSDATGDTYYRAANGKMTRLAAAADGQVLHGTGAGAVPAWEVPNTLLEYSKGHNYTGITRNADQTAYNPGHYATLNPTVNTNRCRVVLNYAWHDETDNTGSRQHLYVALNGGGYSSNLPLGNHSHHVAAESQYLWAHHSFSKTAAEWGWSTGTLQFKHYFACQSSGYVEWGANHNGPTNEHTREDRLMIEAFRYGAGIGSFAGNSAA